MPTAAPRPDSDLIRLLNRDHLRPGDRVCAAVSGGADSVALLLLLHAANRLPRHALGVGLSAVHVHHGLRGLEADGDLAFVEELCARLEVPLHVFHVSVPARMVETAETGRRETAEEAARTLRYGCFRNLAADRRADSILTAHTLDDQAETVLMKLLRGAWTEGLSGIHPLFHLEAGRPAATERHPPGANHSIQGKVLRPLLDVRRAELREFLEARGQAWQEDSTNADEAFTRNRIRHTVLPLLREENPAIDVALANMAVLAREDEARWEAELTRILPQLLLPGKPVRGGGRAVSTAAAGGDPHSESATVALEIDRLRPLDAALRRRVLRAAARSLGARLTFAETARLLDLAGLVPDPAAAEAAALPARAGRTGTQLDLGSGLRAERSLRELRLTRRVPR